MSYRAYPDYRPSGFNGLGELPAAWKARRFRFLVHGIDQGWSPRASNMPAAEDELGVLKLTQADQLFFDQIQEEAIESDTLQRAAAANSKEDFRYVSEKAFEGLVIDRMEGNEEIFTRLMGDGEFRKLALEYLVHKVYGALKPSKDVVVTGA